MNEAISSTHIEPLSRRWVDPFELPEDAREPSPSGTELASLRQQIDQLDRVLVETVASRFAVVREVGELKRASGSAVVDPAREREVISRAQAHARGVPPAVVAGVLNQLITGARFAQSELRVAYLGPETTHSYRAARAVFPDAPLVPCASLEAVIAAIGEDADIAVVPWWNRHAGPVRAVHEALGCAGPGLSPRASFELEVSHVLAARPSARIRRLYTRPEPLAGASSWLACELPGVEVEVELVRSNDEAARRASADWDGAALTTTAAARRYGLELRAEQVDGHDNSTTFVVLQAQP